MFSGFSKSACVLAVAAMGFAALAESAIAQVANGLADTVFVNGKVVTADQAFSLHQAVAIRDGRILAVGSDNEIKELIGPATRSIDLQGRTVLPGLIDTHVHLEKAGKGLYAVQLSKAKTVDEALGLIKEFAAKTPPGEWIQSTGWHPPSQLKEKRYLTRKEIDSVAPNNPVFLETVGHFAMANSLAFRAAKIGASTRNPPGGEYERDRKTGELTGVVTESAIAELRKAIPPTPLAQQVKQMKESMQIANAVGLTSVVLGALDPEDMRALQYVRDHNEATVRAGVMFTPTGETIPHVSAAEWRTIFSRAGIGSEFGDDWLKMSGIKLAYDGGMTLRTAYMRQAYPDDGHYHGTAVMSVKELTNFIEICNEFNWRVGVHVVGDAGVDGVLQAFETVNAKKPITDKRFTLIHASLIQPDQLRRAKALGLRTELQSAFLWSKAGTIARFLTRPTADRAVPTRTMIDIQGINSLGAGSDFPTNLLNPFINMYIMVTRKDINGDVYGPKEAISREEAIRLYTSAAAFATFDEKRKGSIEPGKLADLVVLSDDILSVPEEKIKDIVPLMTIVDGKVVYKRD